MDPFKDLYERICRSLIGWFEVGGFTLISPKVVFEVVEIIWLIRDRLITAQSRQKSYAYNTKRDLEFMLGNLVYLKISPMKGVKRFEKKGKISPRMWGPMRFWKTLSVAYELKLKIELARFIRCSIHQYSKSA